MSPPAVPKKTLAFLRVRLPGARGIQMNVPAIYHNTLPLGLGGMEFAGRTWTWTPTWSVIMEMGGFDPAAANRGAYAGLVHGIASRPTRNPRNWGPPAAAPLL